MRHSPGLPFPAATVRAEPRPTLPHRASIRPRTGAPIVERMDPLEKRA